MKMGPAYASALAFMLSTWAAVYLYAPLSPRLLQVVEALPYTALIWFGCYSLGTISYNMLTFRECPEAAAELLEEIREARVELRKKGLDVDSL